MLGAGMMYFNKSQRTAQPLLGSYRVSQEEPIERVVRCIARKHVMQRKGVALCHDHRVMVAHSSAGGVEKIANSL